jgi:hypothetical protein
MEWLKANKDAFEAIGSVVTALGIVVAGVWTYLVFVRRRDRFPRATVSHIAHHWKVPENKRLIRVALRIGNTGDKLMCVEKGRTWIQQMKPWPADELREFRLNRKTKEVEWPIIAEDDFRFSGQRELEPKETDEIVAEFIIDDSVDQVLVYSFLENAAKPGRNIGWEISTVLDFTKASDGYSDTDMAEKTHQGSPNTRQGQSKPRPGPSP